MLLRQLDPVLVYTVLGVLFAALWTLGVALDRRAARRRRRAARRYRRL